jgi:hypothetical protein
MRTIAAAILILALAVAWHAGERHRATCIEHDRTGCTILPWSNGTAPPRTQLHLDCIDQTALARATGKLLPAC